MGNLSLIPQKTIDLLNEKFEKHNQISFIELDPISIPHQFTKQQDIEIAGLFAAIFAWGQRKTIINKTNHLMKMMDNAPFDFIKNARDIDLQKLLHFTHRTFNDTDLLYFVAFLQSHYHKNDTLETAFINGRNMHEKLSNFRKYFFSLDDFPTRTQKHVSTPANNSACKRLNMYLRWMVRSDAKMVDFGIWKNIKTSELIIPCDVHVLNISKILQLTNHDNASWKTAQEITDNLKLIDKNDPVKYDFALFGLGIDKYFSL